MTAYKKNTIGTWAATEQEKSPWITRLTRLLTDFNINLDSILNRGIKFDDNVDCRIVSYVSNATPNTDDILAHTLGKIPVGFIVSDLDKGGVVYRGSVAFTATSVCLRNTVASANVKIILF